MLLRSLLALQILSVLLICSPPTEAQCDIGEIQKLIPEGTNAGDWVYHPAMDGEWLVVGAPFGDGSSTGSGSAYVYRQGTDGAWSQFAELTAQDAGPGDWFGKHVAIQMPRIVVGATQEGFGAGKAYVFRFDGTSWHEEEKLVASNSTNGRFGSGVSIDGDTIVVGAYQALSTGRAYVFRRIQGVWVEEDILESPDPCPSHSFASHSVGIRGDMIVVGSRYDSQLGSNAGAAFIFRRIGAAWVFDQKLLASDGGPGNTFGWWLETDGSQIIIGAPSYFGAGAGAAYIFESTGSAWVETTKLTSPNPHGGDNFGYFVSIRDSWAAVGARWGDSQGTSSGEAILFGLANGGWDLAANVIPPQIASDDQFSNVALSSTHLAIGALGDDDAGTDAGALYVAPLPGLGLNAAFAALPTEGNVPLTVRFQDTSTGQVTSWLWDFGNGYLSTQRNPIFTYHELGTFTVSLTVSGPCGSDAHTAVDLIRVGPRLPPNSPRNVKRSGPP